MAELTIRTNHQQHELKAWCDLPKKWRKEFDYIEHSQEDAPRFFCYKRWWYDANEFECCGESFPDEWQGFRGDSYFSGVLIRYTNNCESVICATYFC